VTASVTRLWPVVAVLGLLGGARGSAQTNPRPKLAATIFPLYDIVREVGGSVADVVVVLPPGASPHTFEPTPAGVRNLTGAGVLFMIGHGLDDWAARMARGVGVRRTVIVDCGITLRQRGGSVDPHYWLSIANAKKIAATVAEEVERLAPAQRGEVRRALAVYLARLEATDGEIRRLLADLPNKRIATFHDAFGYFADAYGLEVVATFEPFPGKEPGPRFVQEFQRTVRATGLRVLFAEPQLALAPLGPIASDLGVTLSVLDPLGGVPGRQSYMDLMVFDARQVAAASRAPGGGP
jgi:ABC-type Zn uptake system ZnuABC Zn-binding protein ZnuA